MNNVTISTRVEKGEAEKIDALAGEMGLDRGALLKHLILKGDSDIQTERALRAYRQGTISLSRAAEIAGLSIRDILIRLPEESIELNYDLRELERDLESVAYDPDC